MSRFAIFYLTVLFCIPFAPAQPDQRCKIKEASIDDGEDVQTFEEENLLLYETVDKEANSIYLAIGNDVKKLCDDFPINQRNIIVTKGAIYIRRDPTIITLTLEESHFTFYEHLFPLGIVRYTYAVQKAHLGDEILQDVSAIKVKKSECGEWILVAVDGRRTPCLIFPVSFVKSTEIEDFLVVSLILETKPDILTTIKIEFETGVAYNGFYSWIIERRFYK